MAMSKPKLFDNVKMTVICKEDEEGRITPLFGCLGQQEKQIVGLIKQLMVSGDSSVFVKEFEIPFMLLGDGVLFST